LEDGNTKDNGPAETQETGKSEPAEELLIAEEKGEEEKKTLEKRILELNDKYLRLYAEFENYRKRVSKEKEDLVKYSNESLLYSLLPAIDHLELALKHGSCDPKTGVVEGVEITLRELQRTLEKFGLSRIEAIGKQFDPSVHDAMTQVERQDMDEKLVAEELRAGYLYFDKVLRPSLVAVSVKPKRPVEVQEAVVGNKKSEKAETEGRENDPNKKIEEE
jgi:molecular chaperone GrpE